ncbi:MULTISPECIES: ATP-dependent DNA ligase [unclassified Streptomyces]|uniref:ATP-dependent DNA ligase n=1 Tax=unclassified Streptomyces TaxID=2593676 RepID=UPI00081F1B2F|nr:ATP-dependent DNA ligase [Streptomyces sp. LcepLS]MYR26153.1 ATP-dependent DNA ligase [Streptomyces sp. SID4945]SCE96791.1 ATP dependent DNA ligase domain-containing protein [Streptomyces sp. LcepLS]
MNGLPPGFRLPLRTALAEAVDRLPAGAGWVYEPKFDGHRLLVVRGEHVVLQARSGRRVTGAFPDLVEAAERLPEGTVLDGEVVVWTAGRTDFAAVQRRAAATPARAPVLARALPASYAAFDLLALDGEDLRPRPYEERRARLVDLLAPLGPPLQAVPATEERETALQWYEALAGTGVEGIVAKRARQAYRGGRRAWRKVRHRDTKDALVLGYVGTRRAPRLLVLALPGDGTPVASRPLAPALRAGAEGALPADEEGAAEAVVTAAGVGEVPYTAVRPGGVVEVRQETTRQGTVEAVRFRGGPGE